VNQHPTEPISRQDLFAEFWHAYEDGKLIELIDSKGLGKFRSEFPHLQGFLSSSSSTSHLSVWDLKQFLEIDDLAGVDPLGAFVVDYGFVNCLSFEEACELTEIYGWLLKKVDVLNLNRACLAGELFVFASKFDTVDPAHQRLWRGVVQDLHIE
jgi:hypothetical protein